MIQLSPSSCGPSYYPKHLLRNGGPRTVTLYVEEYNSDLNELLLEFIFEDEYSFFLNRDNAFSYSSLNGEEYKPTMLKVYNCSPKARINNKILVIQMISLIRIAYNEQYFSFVDNYEEGLTILGVIRNGQVIADIIDNPELCTIRNLHKSDAIPDSFWREHFRNNYITNPIDNLNLERTLRSKLAGSSDSCDLLDVWDVGQGNSNRLVYENGITLYDLGSSKHNSYATIKKIHNKYSPLMGNNPSLVISHWDTDHYNQLCVAPYTFISTLKCIVFPAFAIGLTAKQVLLRIKTNSSCIAIVPPKVTPQKQIIKIVDLGCISIYIGGKSTSKNNSGLLIRAKGRDSYGYLTGDNTNWSQLLKLTDATNRRIINVVVPHHGGPSGGITSASPLNQPGSAAISVGVNTHNHPNLNTMKDYLKNGYSVIRTDRSGDITIKL